MIKTRWNRFLDFYSDNRKSKIENLKLVVGFIALVVALTMCGARVGAQQPTKVPRIGYLTGTSLSANSARTDGFRQGLRELGYVDGKNIVIEWRSAEGKADRLLALAVELVRLKVDIILTGGPTSNRAAKEATSSIPIVMAFDNDPVGNGLVTSLARPAGNITGLSTLAPEISGKQLELLKEIIPKFSSVAVLGVSNNPGNTQSLKETELVAEAFGVKLQYLDVLGPKDIDTAFRAASKGRAGAVLVLAGSVFNSNRSQVVELALKNRLPAIYPYPEFVQDGGLMTYSVSITVVPGRGYICGQNSQGRQGGRSPGGTAKEV